MGIHIVDTAVRLYVVNQPDVTIGVVNGSTRTNRSLLDFWRIEIGQNAGFETRIGAVSRRGNIGVNFLKQLDCVHSAAMIDEITPAAGAIATTIEPDVAALAIDSIDVSERQPVFPRVIGAQHVGKVSAVCDELQAFGIAV